MTFFYLKVAMEYLWYRIQRPHIHGHGIHSPFLYAFLEKGVYNEIQDTASLNSIELLHKQLQRNRKELPIEDFGAGSPAVKSSKRKLSDLAKKSSVGPKYGELLYRTASWFQPAEVIELGTCLGFGSMYLSAGSPKSTIHTIEGSQALAKQANENFTLHKMDRIRIVKGTFDQLMEKTLKELPTVDLMYIDGNHRKEAVLAYFRMSLPYITEQTVIILDDIRWSPGMFEAWREICKDSHVTLSLDFFRMGIVFFHRHLQKQHFKIFY